jgi:hypothetical protein
MIKGIGFSRTYNLISYLRTIFTFQYESKKFGPFILLASNMLHRRIITPHGDLSIYSCKNSEFLVSCIHIYN